MALLHTGRINLSEGLTEPCAINMAGLLNQLGDPIDAELGQDYNDINQRVLPMLVSFLMSLFKPSRSFAWSPALDLADNEIRSTLLPGAQY